MDVRDDDTELNESNADYMCNRLDFGDVNSIPMQSGLTLEEKGKILLFIFNIITCCMHSC
jgi:hypothetical protein